MSFYFGFNYFNTGHNFFHGGGMLMHHCGGKYFGMLMGLSLINSLYTYNNPQKNNNYNYNNTFNYYNNFSQPQYIQPRINNGLSYSSVMSNLNNMHNNIPDYGYSNQSNLSNPYSSINKYDFSSLTSSEIKADSGIVNGFKTAKTKKSDKIILMSSDKAFDKALEFTFKAEGGYVNHKCDNGGPTNMGMTQKTYDAYRKEKNLPLKDVKSITKKEAAQIYYEKFWLGSGANKIKDSRMAIAYFDAATLHGIGKAKEFYQQSNGDLDKFLQLRRQHFDRIVANNPTQKVFHEGWNNRITNLKNHLNKLA